MGQSKIPIYAYVDETGNSGRNLFDEAQPDFFTAALVTKGDFDTAYGQSVNELAAAVGVQALHGSELGIGRIESISAKFLRILTVSKACFFVSRVEKRYLLATKVFDTLCDSGENAGVAWHYYNVKPLRLMLAFKLASTLSEDVARQFWNCLLEPKEQTARAMLPGICDAILANLDELPDAKARAVLREGLEWARDHQESIQIHVDREIARKGHMPNLVAFANLLDGLEEFSARHRRPVARITHDQQSEFEKILAEWHKIHSVGPKQPPFQWAGEEYHFQRVVGSHFKVCTDSYSPGIQIADIVLWLYAQMFKERDLPDGCMGIIRYVLETGWHTDFSFQGVDRAMSQRMDQMMNRPMSEEQLEAGRDLVREFEARRHASMDQYEQDHLPPFMRPDLTCPGKVPPV